jgi:hypothetical protein
VADEAAWGILKGGAAGAVTVQKCAGARMLFRERIPCNEVSIVAATGQQNISLTLSIRRHAVRRGYIRAKDALAAASRHPVPWLSRP